MWLPGAGDFNAPTSNLNSQQVNYQRMFKLKHLITFLTLRAVCNAMLHPIEANKDIRGEEVTLLGGSTEMTNTCLTRFPFFLQLNVLNKVFN